MDTKLKKLIRDRCNAYRVQDKRKGRDYSNNINYQQFLQIYDEQQGTCWYTGLPLTLENASLERIDCSKGHSYDNCVLVEARLNFSRGNKNIVDFCIYLYYLGLLVEDAAQVLKDKGLVH